jgi:hypothetical protein
MINNYKYVLKNLNKNFVDTSGGLYGGERSIGFVIFL